MGTMGDNKNANLLRNPYWLAIPVAWRATNVVQDLSKCSPNLRSVQLILGLGFRGRQFFSIFLNRFTVTVTFHCPTV
jgi:hypothetical protein